MSDFIFMTDKEISKIFAERIKKERVMQEISQKELSKLSGVSLSKIRRFEQVGNIGLVEIIAIVKTLNKLDSIKDLFDYEKERIELDAFQYVEKLKNKKYARVRSYGK